MATPSTVAKYAQGWLRGFFDGEGSVRMADHFVLHPNGRRYNQRTLEVKATNTDWALIQRCRRYLKIFGIESLVRVARRPGKTWKRCWNVRVVRQQSIKKFAQFIGFTTERKRSRLEKMLTFIDRPRYKFPRTPSQLRH